MTATTTAPLTGDDLLAVYKANKNVSEHELAKLTGYYSVNKNGTDVHNIAGMKKAMLIAMGVNIGADAKVAGKGPGGRKLSYVAKVQGNKNLLVGKAYTAQLGLNPGDEFQIKLTKSGIRLVPVGGSTEDED